MAYPFFSLAKTHRTTPIDCRRNDIAIRVEAVPERLAIKHEIFARVAEHAPEGALLGTNTSQLSITRIGTVLGDRAASLVGMHFFNPPVRMRLVELVRRDAVRAPG